MVVVIVDFGKKVSEAIIRLSEILYESFEKAWLSVKDTMKDTIEALKKFVDECEITFDDDFDTICDKLEKQNAISQQTGVYQKRAVLQITI